MTDLAVPSTGRALVHEPPEPGWSPRPPAAMLRRSRLEAYRRRRLERLRRDRPELHARITALQAWHRSLWDRVLPRERVLPVTLLALGLTAFDGLATLLVVALGIAEEANPLLAGVIDELGLTAAMALRILVGSAFTLALAWLSTWRREARPVLAFVTLLLSAVAVLHVAGIVWTSA